MLTIVNYLQLRVGCSGAEVMAGIFPRSVRRQHDAEQDGGRPISCAAQAMNIGFNRRVVVDVESGHCETALVPNLNKRPDGKCMLRQRLQKVVNVSVQSPCEHFRENVHAGVVVQGNAGSSSKYNDGNGNGLVDQHVQKSDPQVRPNCKSKARL